MALLISTAAVAAAYQGKEERVPLDQLPMPIREAVAKRFPEAKLVSAEKEIEDEVVLFEIALRHQKHDLEVTLTADGAFREIETALLNDEIPKAVAESVEAKYAGAILQKVERIVLVKDGKEQTAAFEAKVQTKDKKNLEIKLDADGRMLKVEEDDEE
jgi:hypothetical protein